MKPPSRLYAAPTSAVVMALVGGVGMLAHQPWLFPSLGPTIFLQTVTPNDRAARPWNTFAGHRLGIAAGFAAVFLFEAHRNPSPMASGTLAIGRVAATALAVGLTIERWLHSEKAHDGRSEGAQR